MADDLSLTEGSGAEVATEDRSGVHFQRVIDTGGDAIAAARVNVTSTSAEAVAARARRRGVILLALSTNTQTVDIGASGVAAGSGFPLEPGDSMSLATAGAIHADTPSGTQVLAYIEVYD